MASVVRQDGDPPRRRRRSVGPAGAPGASQEPRLGLAAEPPAPGGDDDDERLRRDRPPHHDQGV